MFAKDKVSQSMIDAVNKVVEEGTGNIKIPTATGTKVLGGSGYGSAHAHRQQTKHSVDDVKEPSKKAIEKDSKLYKNNDNGVKKNYKRKETGDYFAGDYKKKEDPRYKNEEVEIDEALKGNQSKIDANHNNKIDGQDFAILRGKKKVKEDMHFAKKLLEAEKAKSPAKNQDIADKSYLKDKPGSVKSDLKNLGRFLTGKKETNEEVVLDEGIFTDDESIAKHLIKKHGKNVRPSDIKLAMHFHPEPHKTSLERIAGHVKRMLPVMQKEEIESVEENYKQPDDAVITTDTLAGRLPGGKINSFKSYKLRVKPVDKEGDGSIKEPDCDQPEKTAARASVHAEATIAGTSGWEPMKKDIKDKSGAVHTPMSRARDLAKSAFKRVQDKTKIKQ